MQILSGLRPWTFSASLVPVVLGAVLGFKFTGAFDATSAAILVLSLGVVLAVNSAGNMVNTYFDYARALNAAGVTSPPPPTSAQVSGGATATARAEALMAAHQRLARVVNAAAYLYGFAMACLWALMAVSPAASTHLAGLFFGGLSSSFIYTGGVGVKHYILGDLLVVFTFGPLAFLFSFVAQTGKMAAFPLLLALPLAVSTEAILISKHAGEVEEDRRGGVLTLAVLLGPQGSYLLYAFLLFSPYLVFFMWGLRVSLPLALPVLTVPFSFRLERAFREEEPDHAPHTESSRRNVWVGTAKLNLAMGLLFVAGCMLASRVPWMDSYMIEGA